MATFGYEFNQLVDLPLNIVYLKLDCNNTSIIDYLPSSIEELELGEYFNLELNNLPNSIKKIIFPGLSQFNHELNCLPLFVEVIELPVYYNKRILNIPKGLKKVICYKEYEFINDFDNIEVKAY